MRFRPIHWAALAVLSTPGLGSGQALSTPTTGPIIDNFGPVYRIDAPDFATPSDAVIRALFEVAVAADEPDQLNRRIESLARFLNMHAQAGVPRENLKLALVVHGTAGKDLLGNEGYQKRYGRDNPNLALLNDLIAFGVEVVLCGQTQSARGLPREELAPGVKVALSAMTALVALQSQGYHLAAF